MENKTQHTPGPWKVGALNHTSKTWVNDGWDIIAQCPVVERPKGWDKQVQITEANARLIAAAPELLALLKDVGNWLETHLRLGHINAGTGNRDGDLVSQISAIIAKAEGTDTTGR